MIAGPVLGLCVQDFELEWEQPLIQPAASILRLDPVYDGEKVRAFGRSLVEESHACKGGKTEVP